MTFKHRLCVLALLLTVFLHSTIVNAQKQKAHRITNSSRSANVQCWLTNADKHVLFQKQSPDIQLTTAKANAETTIDIKDKPSYQTMDGFGFCLTGGSAMLIHQMDAKSRSALLRELFTTQGNNIGVSYLRISIGASDLDDHAFSYDDLSAGETDPHLKHFSLNEDKKHLIPVLKEIIRLAPSIKILGSPWSPPTWMKTNDSSKGGSLKPEFYDAYARYFVKYIQQMKAEGITIDAITVQNEPLHPGNNPSMLMLAPDQAKFVKNNLGPAFKAANVKTKIIVYDHNADRPDYPISILNDPAAKKYVDGSAFHLYGGPIEALSEVHKAHPDKNVYFTEQWVGAPGNFPKEIEWHIKNLIIGAPNNWARTVLEWNLASDPQQNPHTPGGCDRCLGAVTIDGNNVTRNPAYYIIAHASKFVRPGSVRIYSTKTENLPNVAYATPSGQKVLIVQNDGKAGKDFDVVIGARYFKAHLDAAEVATYVIP
jgi:glucosylceramidase